MEKLRYSGNSSRLTVRIPPDLHKALREAAQTLHISQCEILRIAITNWLGLDDPYHDGPKIDDLLDD